MTNNMTYENLLDTFDRFEAYLNEIKRLQEEKVEQERQEVQRQRELAEQRKKEQAIADDKAAYERAKRTNSKASHEKYLKNFSNGAYRTEAKTKVDHFLKLEQEEQTRIQQQREAEAQRQHEFEEQRKKEQAEQQRQEVQRQREQAIANAHQAFEAAKRTDTISAYETYLRNHPYGTDRDKYDAMYRINNFIEKAEAEHREREKIEKDRKDKENNQIIRWIKFFAMIGGISVGTGIMSNAYTEKDVLAFLGFLATSATFGVLFGGIFGMGIRTILNRKSLGIIEKITLTIFAAILAIAVFNSKKWDFIIIAPLLMIAFSTIKIPLALITEEIICKGFFSGIDHIEKAIVPPIRIVIIWVIFWSIIGWMIAINFIPEYNDLFESYLTVWAITGFGLGLLIMKKFTRQL